MEQNWERTLPFINIDVNTAEVLFESILEKTQIKNISSILEGCRTTNYIITTEDKKYLLKIFFSNEQNYKKEVMLLNKLKKDEINVQSVYKISKSNLIEGKEFGIYEYVDGISLGRYLAEGNKVDKAFISSISRALAKIHSYRFERAGFFDENLKVVDVLPPLRQWYEMFLNKNARIRLGTYNVEKISMAVSKYQGIIDHLDKDIRLVHGDFQGTNILINDNKLGCILDWEFSMAGHPLADIGQFFRYDQYYDRDLIMEFERGYRKYSDYILPDDWYKISKLRDMVNLIQLMGMEQHMPNKFNDIKNIIERSLNILL